MRNQRGDNVGSTLSWTLYKEYLICTYSEFTPWYPQTFHHHWQAGKWNTVVMAITGHGRQLNLNRWLWRWAESARARTGRTGHHGGRWGLMEDRRTGDLMEGGLPQPALCIHDALKEQCHPGPLPGLRATRMRLIFVLIDARSHSSCTFQLHSFYVREYSSLDLVWPENTNQVLRMTGC